MCVYMFLTSLRHNCYNDLDARVIDYYNFQCSSIFNVMDDNIRYILFGKSGNSNLFCDDIYRFNDVIHTDDIINNLITWQYYIMSYFFLIPFPIMNIRQVSVR